MCGWRWVLARDCTTFTKAFAVFREYRVLMDTPEIPIRSVAMGLVEIHGKATGIPPIPSPVTQTPCYFYKVDIEHWVTDKNGGHWNHLATDADGKRFYLADATGKVLVDAHKAEYDLIQTARVETGRSFGSGSGASSRASAVPPGLRGRLQFRRPLVLRFRGGRAPERQRHFWRGVRVSGSATG